MIFRYESMAPKLIIDPGREKRELQVESTAQTGGDIAHIDILNLKLEKSEVGRPS